MYFSYHRVLVCLSILSTMFCGPVAVASDLREGERLEGFTFHTYLEIPFESKQRAEQWMAMNPDLADAKLVQDEDGRPVVRMSRVIDNILRLANQSRLGKGERFENGVFIHRRAHEYESEAAARTAKISYVYSGVGEVVDLGVEESGTHKGKFRRTVEIRWNLLEWARGRNQLHAQWLKSVVRNPGGGIRPLGLNDYWSVTEASFGDRKIIDFLVQTHLANSKPDRVNAEVSLIKRRGPVRHALLHQIVHRPTVELRRFDDQYVLFAEGKHVLTDNVARVVVWESGPDVVVSLGFAPDVDIEPLVRAYLAWHPSTWPTADYKFDRMDWVKEEVEIAIELLAWFVSDEVREESRADLTSHLGELNRDNAIPKQDMARTHNFELYAIERWVDAPIRMMDPMEAFPVEQADYDRTFRELLAWWKTNRDEVKLRPGAPFKTAGQTAKIDNLLTPRQVKLNADLIVAIEKKQVRRAEQLLADGADPNAAKLNLNLGGIYPRAISLALGNNDKAMVALLLKAGASPNPLIRPDGPPLIGAARTGDPEMVQMLLDAGATFDPKYFKRHGRHMVVTAAALGNNAMLECLLGLGHDIEELDAEGRTPLMLAVEEGRVETVRLLIKRGANLNAKSKLGRTVLWYALRKGNGNPAMVRILLDLGLKPDAACMFMAADDTKLEAFKMLVKAGGDLQSTAPDYTGTMMTPLEKARNYDQPRTIAYLERLAAARETKEPSEPPTPIKVKITTTP